METMGRTWNIDAGEGAFPCGEVYIAPLEDKTNGTIFFKKFVLEGIGTFHIGLGMNAMFGGNNNCRFHMDFVTEGEIIGSN